MYTGEFDIVQCGLEAGIRYQAIRLTVRVHSSIVGDLIDKQQGFQSLIGFQFTLQGLCVQSGQAHESCAEYKKGYQDFKQAGSMISPCRMWMIIHGCYGHDV